MLRLQQLLAILLATLLPLQIAAAPAPPTSEIKARQNTGSSQYWLPSIQRQGAVAYGSDPTYKVFRNVKDFGVKGDGNTDDFAAINATMWDGDRCGWGCNSSTVKPALVYFPPGIYRISQPIVMPYYTQMVGDATDMPTIQALAGFQGIALVDSDPYIPGVSNQDGSGINFYRNQNNFFRQLRNFKLDITTLPETNPDGITGPACLHWQVAQATSVQNVVFQMLPKSSTNKQQGIFMENGSGGFMTDLVFNGGGIGAWLGNQQFTTRNWTFNGVSTAVIMNWNWLWTFKSLSINNADIGIDMSALGANGSQTVGSVMVLDSSFNNCGVGIKTARNETSLPSTGGTLAIQNTNFSGTPTAVAGFDGVTQVLPGNQLVGFFGQGDALMPASGGSTARVKRTPQMAPSPPPETECTEVPISTISVIPIPAQSTGGPSPNPESAPIPDSSAPAAAPSSSPAPNPASVPVPAASAPAAAPSSSAVPSPNPLAPNGTVNGVCTHSPVPNTPSKIQGTQSVPSIASSLLNSNGQVFERSKPQYETIPVTSFVSVKSAGAKGDGTTDDSDVIQQVFNNAQADQIIYFDHGAYVITKTINVPKNIKITGEVWPLLMASGPFFSDQTNPQPVFRIGAPGDSGNVELSDLVFGTKGPAAGAIMIEWNVAGQTQGSAGMWDAHVRIGGYAGSDLQTTQCRGAIPNTQTFNANCAGAFLMLHITQTGSAYIENSWFWIADHELDLPGEDKLNIFNGRGVLVESKGPVWLYGTASEHSVFYNYQFSNAQDVFMGAIQTETAYMQTQPNALTSGFTPNPAFSDPDFASCTTDSCKKTWGLRIVDSSSISMFGGGLYSFFDNYSQDCLLGENCQENMIDIQCSTDVNLVGLTTKASVNMIDVNGQSAAIHQDHKNGFGATLVLAHFQST